ncbi:secreted metal-dependent hydrolase, amidohydrolase family protein [Janthinobacterium sp. HH01]|uniref:CIA30 family protein n=1 Tax=Janthinobacterium sp. HH01 TaxID=1198452 RepID=UPI0002AEE1DA|nr:CIA30 family protein [Janthinobacterium sp. HH01]ELX08176.1 secreted metal-dependent hydrolase, amidohydrolase family protein [Janthinobacterium sp. HH01]
MKPVLSKVLFVCGLGLTLPALADTWLIRDARVFDGEQMHAKRSVLVKGDKIVDADFRGRAPAGARIVEGAGRTLMPGLIDAHVHAYRYLDLPLMFGVTTQIDMFTGVATMQQISEKMRNNDNRAQSDVYSAGTLVTAPGGHGTEYGMAIPTLTRPEDAQAFVDARIAEGSYFIKIVMEGGSPGHPMKTLDLPTVKAVIAAAHARGKLAVVHISNLESASAALDAGADGLAHLFNGARLSDQELAAFVKLAQQKRAFIGPTMSVLESIAGLREDDVLGDAGLAGLLNKEQTAPLKVTYGKQANAALMAAPRQVVAALSQARVPLLAGTDAGNSGTQYGVSLLHELNSLVQAGLTPPQALAAATSAPARAFKLADRGRIAKGYKANLLLVQGDAGRDIGALHNIVEVWKDGDAVSPLRKAQQESVAAELAPRTKPPMALPADGRISQFSADKLASPFGLGWGPSVDKFMGGQSSVELKVQDADADGQRPLAVSAKVAPGFAYPWAGLAFMPGAQPMQPADLRGAKVLRFRVKGDGRRYNVAVMSTGVSIPVNQSFQASEQWQEVVLPFDGFKGIDFGAVTMIAFNAGPELGEYSFQIADVRLLNE